MQKKSNKVFYKEGMPKKYLWALINNTKVWKNLKFLGWQSCHRSFSGDRLAGVSR